VPNSKMTEFTGLWW